MTKPEEHNITATLIENTIATYRSISSQIEEMETGDIIKEYKKKLEEREHLLIAIKALAVENKSHVEISPEEKYRCVTRVKLEYDEKKIKEKYPEIYDMCVSPIFDKKEAEKYNILNQFVETHETTFMQKVPIKPCE